MPRMAATNAGPEILNVFKTLWWSLSVTGVVLCPVIIWASRLPHGRGIVLLCTVIPAAIRPPYVLLSGRVYRLDHLQPCYAALVGGWTHAAQRRSAAIRIVDRPTAAADSDRGEMASRAALSRSRRLQECYPVAGRTDSVAARMDSAVGRLSVRLAFPPALPQSERLIRAAQQNIRLVRHWVIDELPFVVFLLLVVNADGRIFTQTGDADDGATTKRLITTGGVLPENAVAARRAGGASLCR